MSDEKPGKKPRVRRRKKDAEPAAEGQAGRAETTPSEGSAGADEATPEAAASEGEQAEATPDAAGAGGAEADTAAPEQAQGDEGEPEEAKSGDSQPGDLEQGEAEPGEDSGETEAGEDSAGAQSGEADAERPRRRRRGAAETTTSSSTSRGEQARPAPRDPQGAVHVRAQAKYVRSAPRKARLVMDHIRGKRVADARAILHHTPRAAAADISKLLESAVANAENNFELDPEDLKIGRAYVDEGPTIKRYRPRAQGRATPINKRTSHMTISLTEVAPADMVAGPAKSRRRVPAKRGERG